MKKNEIDKNEIIEILKKCNLKSTPQRIEIFRFLKSTKIHPSPDLIFSKLKKKFNTISRATVYNTVQTLYNKGIIKKLDFGEGFERCDGDSENHLHFYCKKCKKILDIYKSLDRNFLKKIEQTENIKIDNTEIYIKGLCFKCKK
ncbi:MAG TPA: Fur family transcriptional regulator [bacterium]|nr:Fur family transcriptional regulator [bacterium]HPP86428.1 Fur family transcriptional regulator [bacterium]